MSEFTVPSVLNNGSAKPNGTAFAPVIVCCFPSASVIVLDFSTAHTYLCPLAGTVILGIATPLVVVVTSFPSAFNFAFTSSTVSNLDGSATISL